MGRGLDSFDSYSWRSLLAGQEVLICVRERGAAFRLADGLEAAGARVTIAEDQAIALDRAARRRFSIVVLVLDGSCEPSKMLRTRLDEDGARIVILAAEERHAALGAAYPDTSIVERSISDRELVMFLVKTADE